MNDNLDNYPSDDAVRDKVEAFKKTETCTGGASIITFLKSSYKLSFTGAIQLYRRLYPRTDAAQVRSGWETACKDAERRLYACEQQRDALSEALVRNATAWEDLHKHLVAIGASADLTISAKLNGESCRVALLNVAKAKS